MLELPQLKSHVGTQSMHSRRNYSYHQAPFRIDGEFVANVTAYVYLLPCCNYHQVPSRFSFSCDDLDAEKKIMVINRQDQTEEDKGRLMGKRSKKTRQIAAH